MRGATGRGHQGPLGPSISTHAPLAGRDGRGRASRVPPRGNFNPRAPCGARPPRLGGSDQTAQISTHAPLAGRDSSPAALGRVRRNFNPRAPCGARPGTAQECRELAAFQPTRPLRGATSPTCAFMIRRAFQPTRPLRGATAASLELLAQSARISTHAPLAGRDFPPRPFRIGHINFNPRAPCGARRA